MTLYDVNLATYEGVTTFDQTLAKGFIELWGLQTKAANIVKRAPRHSKTAVNNAT